MRHLIPISGKDSLATAIIQTTIEPDHKYEFCFNDTGSELPEVYEWLDLVESRRGWKITRIGYNLIDLIKSYNGYLPSPQSRYCTRQAKIQPMQAWIQSGDDSEITLYYGLRADEASRRGYIPIAGQTVRYPLIERGIDLQGVWSILSAQDLLPPAFFWERLYLEVSRQMGRNMPEILPWQKAMFFSGRTRANCFHCFFQRQYEFLWLLETHPDLFEQSEALEKEKYTILKEHSLAYIRENAVTIFNRRVKEVCKDLSTLAQYKLFGYVDDLAQTSCGLLCGK